MICERLVKYKKSERNAAENRDGHVRIATGCGFREGAHFWSRTVSLLCPLLPWLDLLPGSESRQ